LTFCNRFSQGLYGATPGPLERQAVAAIDAAVAFVNAAEAWERFGEAPAPAAFGHKKGL
jgi:hypothetical protein